MGYCVYMNGGMFGIRAKNIDKALEAVCKAIPMYEKQDSISSIQSEIEDYQFLPSISKLRKIVLGAWFFELESDDDGNVVGVQWEGEKLHGGIMNWMRAVAPWVPAGCYIEMCGEDGDKWRYIFNGQNVIEKHPKVIWE